jgi:protein ImuB
VADLRILPRKPEAEQAALRRLGAWAMTFSDQVSLEPPAALVLEAGRSLKLFGGAAALRQRLQGGVSALGWRARCVLAPTPSGALLLAAAGLGAVDDPDPGRAIVSGRDQLRRLLVRLPVAALGCSRRELDDLQAMGIGRIGELLRLPRAGLAERLGPGRLVQLERLLGERPDPRRPFVPPERFRGRAGAAGGGARCTGAAVRLPTTDRRAGRLPARTPGRGAAARLAARACGSGVGCRVGDRGGG